MVSWQIPELRDVIKAEKILRSHFPPSPVIKLNSGILPDVDVSLKLENLLPTGAFKVRGATYLMSQLNADEKKSGVIAASTGNFSQGISYAARLYGVKARIVMPENSNPRKVKATRDLGGEVIFHGAKFDDSRKFAEELSSKHGYRYVHSANEPMLVAGVGTHTLELLHEQPDIDVIIVPVGGGSGASGVSVVAKAVSKNIAVIGVQSERSPAAYRSWKSGKPEVAENSTYADGVATGESFEFTQSIMRAFLDDFLLVSDEEIRSAQRTLTGAAKMSVESASASTLAAGIRLQDRLKGKKVALIITGGNVSPGEIDEQI